MGMSKLYRIPDTGGRPSWMRRRVARTCKRFISSLQVEAPEGGDDNHERNFNPTHIFTTKPLPLHVLNVCHGSSTYNICLHQPTCIDTALRVSL